MAMQCKTGFTGIPQLQILIRILGSLIFIFKAILQGIYWGFGTGCGAVFGGYCLQRIGFRQTFLAFTVITCVVAFVFLVAQLTVYIKDPDALNELYSESSRDFDGDDEETTSEEEEDEEEKQLQKE